MRDECCKTGWRTANRPKRPDELASPNGSSQQRAAGDSYIALASSPHLSMFNANETMMYSFRPITVIQVERYAPVRRATCIGSPLCRRLLLFLFCYFFLRVVPASKQLLAEHVIRYPGVMRQNCRPKTKFGIKQIPLYSSRTAFNKSF